MASFDEPVKHWKWKIKGLNQKAVSFPSPHEIGFYSVDEDKKFQNNNQQLKYIFKLSSGWNAELSSPWNLDEGCGQAILYYEDNEHDTHILKWILLHQDIIRNVFTPLKSNKEKIDFVCTRHFLKKMCCTTRKTNQKDDWVFYACMFKSTIYLCLGETDLEIQEGLKETAESKQKTLWGSVFEKHMTVGSEGEEITPVNKNEAFYVILKGQINDYTLLYSAEVDGKDPDVLQNHLDSNKYLNSTDCYMELKIAEVDFENYEHYSKKLAYWWIQSFLVGIPKAVCGIRDKNGIVLRLKTYYILREKEEKNKDTTLKTEINETNNLKTGKDPGQKIYMDDAKENCLKICHKVLEFVKHCVQEENHGSVYRFEHKRKSKEIWCKKLTDSKKYEEILPKWFTN